MQNKKVFCAILAAMLLSGFGLTACSSGGGTETKWGGANTETETLAETETETEVFPGKERHAAIKRFEEIKKARPGIEAVKDIERKSWER